MQLYLCILIYASANQKALYWCLFPFVSVLSQVFFLICFYMSLYLCHFVSVSVHLRL